MEPKVTPAREASDLEAARAIRHAVFVVEQGVPSELEVDGLDPSCDHYLVWHLGAPVATARARRTAKGWKIERVAVLKEHRRHALGTLLIRSMLERRPSAAAVYVHAQQEAVGFWERLGFRASGPTFEEGGIAHRYMQHASV